MMEIFENSRELHESVGRGCQKGDFGPRSPLQRASQSKASRQAGLRPGYEGRKGKTALRV